MKGLILKDFINLKRFIKTFLVFVLVYGGMSFMQKDASYFSSIFTVLFALLTISTYTFDETVKWDGYALTMPLSKDNIVQGKYLVMLLFSLFGSGLSLFITIFINFMIKADHIFRGTQVCAIGAAVIILFYSITLPIITKLGVEKARLIIIMIYLIPFFSGYMVIKAINNGKITLSRNLIHIGEAIVENIYFVLPVVLIVALYLSYTISIGIYRRKEF